jgi:hypothetical protein
MGTNDKGPNNNDDDGLENLEVSSNILRNNSLFDRRMLKFHCFLESRWTGHNFRLKRT